MLKKTLTTFLLVIILVSIFPVDVFATAAIRQEINIIDRIVTASGDDTALIQLDTTKYNNATYYFEVVAKVDSGTLTVALERAGTSTQDITRTVTATSYTRVRSASFTPPAGATQYNINLASGTNPMVKAARIVILQSGSTISGTQTQIEIGNYEAAKSNSTPSALTAPKYWKYDSSKWDTTPTFYAEATYKKTTGAGTTITIQEDDGSFASWDDIATVIDQGTASSATRVRSAFTPTNGLNYRLSSYTVPSYPTFLSAGAIAEDLTGACAITPTPPSHLADDILIASLWNEGGSKPVTATAGWNEIATGAGTADATWYWKRATGAGTAGPSVTAADTDCFGMVYIIRGAVASGTPYEDATTSGDGGTTDTTPDTATVTTTASGRLVMAFINHDDDVDFASNNPPSGWTAGTSTVNSAGGTDVGFKSIGINVPLAANANTVPVGTWSVGQSYWGLTLAFLPVSTVSYDVYNGKVVVDQLSTTSSTYYFDASDSGPTDTDAAWTNDANAFDGDTTDEATRTTVLADESDTEPATKLLVAGGTTAPTSGSNIASVEARFYSDTNSGHNPSYTSYETLSAPSGGWTWTAVNDLSAKIWADVGNACSPSCIAVTRVNIYSGAERLTGNGTLTRTNGIGSHSSVWNVEIRVNYFSGAVNLIEPQYLLANTLFSAGTSLQDFDTIYNTADWDDDAGSTVFIHEANGAAAGTSDVKLQNTTGPVDITGSTITDVVQREQSSSLTMPADGTTIDVIATTNNSDLGSSRILVQYDYTATAGGTLIKTILDLPEASVKTIFDLPNASMKSFWGLE